MAFSYYWMQPIKEKYIQLWDKLHEIETIIKLWKWDPAKNFMSLWRVNAKIQIKGKGMLNTILVHFAGSYNYKS